MGYRMGPDGIERASNWEVARWWGSVVILAVLLTVGVVANLTAERAGGPDLPLRDDPGSLGSLSQDVPS